MKTDAEIGRKRAEAMTGQEASTQIQDLKVVDHSRRLTDCFISHSDPLKVILSGSFADGIYSENSNYDFYPAVEDGRNVRGRDRSDQAYSAVMYVKKPACEYRRRYEQPI